ncbi:hypothetical protein PVL29_007705 [Vitis rotundifolia]|uniref:Uncharacterized protein n=1 Tax=Vitis rotundifolia TaxID=103349 RepID=A0AA39DV48_VITRO|nr:hypothetical protein PVL29_007705 [Vitis rotundifolia]
MHPNPKSQPPIPSRMSESVSQQFSLFRSQIKSRRFDDGTLRILESVLVSKDVRSFLEVRSSLREFMRSESLSVIREIAEKNVEHKILILDFFVRAFALAGDVESCLALRYEALVLRELKSTSYQWLQVSHIEWLTFAEQALDNGFYSVAAKACENALLSLQMNDIAEHRADQLSGNVQIVEKIKRLKDVALASVVSLSVQAQATEHLKKKNQKSKKNFLFNKGAHCLASTLFTSGIKKQNARKLLEHQRLQPFTNQS